jgi:hypothetical protein
MAEMAEMRAFDALAKHERLADLVALVRAVAMPAAETHAVDWRAPEKVKSLALERKLDGTEASANLADLLRVLEVGPESPEDHALARALWAHAVAEARPKSTEEEDQLAKASLWLAAHTPFDATMLFDRALGDEAGDLWAAVAHRVRQLEQGAAPDMDRVEALVGAAALARSGSPLAQKHASALADDVKDPGMARLLRREPPPGEDAELEGDLVYAPRGVVATTLLALSGILFFIHVTRLTARAALAYKKPAKVTVSATSVRIHWHTEILGRTLRDRDVVLAREGLASVAREVRYPRAAFYAGLFFLAAGSFVGVRTLADGVRAASPTLLLTGFVFVALGILLDFALGSLVPGAAGKCRLFIVPTRGSSICLAGVDAAQADAALGKLSR